ncbi:MAG: putative U3 small nucleolar RNA-associated protein 25 [Streblomastix strix]|uniref:Putative U3 small nucleolar RNA-associated protein 25 n=1 Tax=Streblomastix strix TaxID=222440 RepID=A0A5J4X1E4_9EUKA|nr:MAG: putative U3 small nucleolar RNA-associated protein 25 [Streblomastix strix]
MLPPKDPYLTRLRSTITLPEIYKHVNHVKQYIHHEIGRNIAFERDRGSDPVLDSITHLTNIFLHKDLFQEWFDIRGGKANEEIISAIRDCDGFVLEGNLCPIEGCMHEQQREIIQPLFGYEDIMYCKSSPNTEKRLRQIVMLHVLNHILKSRSLITANNFSLDEQKKKEQGNILGKVDNQTSTLSVPTETSTLANISTPLFNADPYRDKGFARPRVLFLCATRNTAYELVDSYFLRLIPKYFRSNISHRAKFKRLFGPPEEEQEDIDTSRREKPASYKRAFKGNSDEDFIFGIGLTRRSIKIMCKYSESDILFASPLGLVKAFSNTEHKRNYHNNNKNRQEGNKRGKSKWNDDQSRDQRSFQSKVNIDDSLDRYSLLSGGRTPIHSIELADDERLSFFSSHILPLLISNENKQDDEEDKVSRRRKGKRNTDQKNKENKRKKQTKKEDNSDDELQKKKKRKRSQSQSSSNDDHDDEDEFDQLSEFDQLPRTVIFFSSFFEFYRVRALLQHKLALVDACEHTSIPTLTKGRMLFFEGKVRLLLYTSRLHYYRRYNWRRVERVIFFGIPDDPEFFVDMLVMLGEGSVLVLFNNEDEIQLERIVGKKVLSRMLPTDEQKQGQVVTRISSEDSFVLFAGLKQDKKLI